MQMVGGVATGTAGHRSASSGPESSPDPEIHGRAGRAIFSRILITDAFAGAIRAWLGDPPVSKGDLVAAAVACAPACRAAVAERSDPSR